MPVFFQKQLFPDVLQNRYANFVGKQSLFNKVAGGLSAACNLLKRDFKPG